MSPSVLQSNPAEAAQVPEQAQVRARSQGMGYELFYIIGALILLIGIGYAVWQDRTRNKRVDPITDAATKEEYEHPERYEREQEDFARAAERAKERSES